jgi:acetyl-CoA carboxylase biotin carboxyl carrier protein
MNTRYLKSIIKAFESSSLSKLAIRFGDQAIEMERPLVIQSQSVITERPVKEELGSIREHWVKAPLVGTFYASSSPKEPTYVKVGDTVQKGQTLCIIEAMKVMNEIKSPVSGIVQSILVVNEEVVEYDQPLMVIGL